jgi:signal transduction histidine kinase
VQGEELVYYVVVNLLVLVVVTLLASYLAERLTTAGGRIVAAEERADRAEHMAELGRLATGLAHEIRNPLGSISGAIQLLSTNSGLSGDDRQLCEIIQREASRLNDLVSDMMNVAKPRAPEPSVVDLSATVRDVIGLAARSGRSSSDVSVVFDGEDGVAVRADGAQLRQLIWNLVRNAVQASNAGDEVRVSVVLEKNGHVILTVEDHGVGLDETAKQRLFDAFFTTRSHGTGIGLAVVKRIADDHGFSIRVDSEEGQGATFTVDLGLSVEGAPAGAAPPASPSTPPPML